MTRLSIRIDDPEVEAILEILRHSKRGALSSVIKAMLLNFFDKDTIREKSMLLNDVLPYEARRMLRDGEDVFAILDAVKKLSPRTIVEDDEEEKVTREVLYEEELLDNSTNVVEYEYDDEGKEIKPPKFKVSKK